MQKADTTSNEKPAQGTVDDVVIPAWFSLLVGLLMAAQWVFFLVTGQVPELHTAPIRIAFHLVAESVTAVSLMIAGMGLLRKKSWGRSAGLFAHGLLVYTVVVSPGYFAQAGEWPMVAMFCVLVILAAASVAVLARVEP